MSSKKYALLSVYNKAGIVDFAKVLENLGYEIISTGGTFNLLKENDVKVTPIEEVTGNPRDSFDGRMKTISFQIEGGILFDRKNPKHVEEAKKLKVPQIDIVVCNLYPFETNPATILLRQNISNPNFQSDCQEFFRRNKHPWSF